MHFWLWFISLVCLGCSTPEGKARKQNLHGEYIYRRHNEHFFTLSPPTPHPREAYPWEKNRVGGFPRITKDFFACKGNALSPVIVKERGEEKKNRLYYYDCAGGRMHGLPLRDGQEFVYPCLIELLNYLQEETQKRVVITCGHRCPEHNAYADPSPGNWGSKHMLGAEVDFYIEGMEQQPLELVALIERYYQKTPPFAEQKEFTHFKRYEAEGLNVSTPPWYNKEVFVKLYLPQEGRDADNQHPFPYLGIQVRYDRERCEKVTFEGERSQNYLRH